MKLSGVEWVFNSVCDRILIGHFVSLCPSSCFLSFFFTLTSSSIYYRHNMTAVSINWASSVPINIPHRHPKFASFQKSTWIVSIPKRERCWTTKCLPWGAGIATWEWNKYWLLFEWKCARIKIVVWDSQPRDLLFRKYYKTGVDWPVTNSYRKGNRCGWCKILF